MLSITSGQNSFKSRGERQIAAFLDQRGIAYDYEYPVVIVEGGKTKIWYPDFRLPEYGVIVEYFGMNGDAAYNDQTAHKMAAYNQAGFNAIFLFDSTLRGDWREMIIGRIEQTLEGKLRKIRNQRMAMNHERRSG